MIRRTMSNKHRTDLINVVDVEATCWGDQVKTEVDFERDGLHVNEIIEIGICPLDVLGLTMPKGTSIMVKPAVSEISEFCTKLTTITPDMVKNAPSFWHACNRLTAEFHSRNLTWASWGDYDRIQFERDCAAYDDPASGQPKLRQLRAATAYPFGRRHINVKTLFALVRATAECSLSAAMEQLGMEFSGTPHRGDDDAYNVARVLKDILHNARGDDYRGTTFTGGNR